MIQWTPLRSSKNSICKWHFEYRCDNHTKGNVNVDLFLLATQVMACDKIVFVTIFWSKLYFKPFFSRLFWFLPFCALWVQLRDKGLSEISPISFLNSVDILVACLISVIHSSFWVEPWNVWLSSLVPNPRFRAGTWFKWANSMNTVPLSVG